MYKNIGIDLGASKVTVSAEKVGILSTEEALAALRGEDGSLLGIGDGIDRYGVEGDKEVVLRRVFHESPVVPEYTRAIISKCIEKWSGTSCGRLLLSIPCNFSEVEEGALAEMAVSAGASEVYLVYSPVAALVGNGLGPDISAIVVDIGATRTNMIAVCHGRIFCKKTYTVGGESFDRAIADYLLREHKVLVDAEVAETVKIKVGTVWVGNEKRTVEVHGRDITNNDYCTVRVSSEEMFAALEEPMAALIEGVCETITKIPADCVQDVFDIGILLSGGGCLLEGIDKMIGGVTGVNASRLHNPKEAVAMGLAELLSSDLKAAGTYNVSRYIMKTAVKSKGGTTV